MTSRLYIQSDEVLNREFFFSPVGLSLALSFVFFEISAATKAGGITEE